MHSTDDLDDYLAERVTDPVFAASYEDAQMRSELLRSMVTARQHRDVSQGSVARLMGTTQSAVSDLERGATDPRFSTLQRYARAIGQRLVVALQTASTHRQLPGRQEPSPRPAVHVEAVGANAEVAFWTPLADHYTRYGSARSLASPFTPHTKIAAVEHRPHADGYALDIGR